MKKVILVEDNKIEVRNISHIIEAVEDCQLLGAFPNGLRAMEFLRQSDVDIVITDVQMPKMDGIDLAKNIRAEGMDAEIIIISGYQDFNNAKSAVGLGVVDYVLKPILDDELEISIKKAISRCNDKQSRKSDYEKLKSQIESSKQLFLEQFIRSLIINPEATDEYIKNNEEIFNINLIDGYKMLFVIKIKEENGNNTLVTLYAIMDYILKYKSDEATFYPFMMNDNEVGAVALSDDYKALISQIIKLKSIIRSDYEINLLVGLSSVSSDIRSISRLYQECKSALKEINNIWNIVVMYEDIDEDSPEENVFADIQGRVRKLVIKGDSQQIKKFLSAGLDRYSKSELINKRNFAYGYVNALETIFAEYGFSFDDSELFSVKDVWKKLADFDAIIDINNFLENLTLSVVECIRKSSYRKSKLTNAVIAIIEKRYSEHITASSIASEINFSRKQIHRIFTQETGMTIFEYLTNYRIEKAMELLKEGKSVDDVIFAVGYKDKANFYEIFREKTGTTPVQFKNNVEEKS